MPFSVRHNLPLKLLYHMRGSFLSLLLTTVVVSSASAHLWYISVTPESPQVGDTVRVKVYGEMPDDCWSITSADWDWRTYNLLAADVYSYDCLDRECFGCATSVVPINTSFEFTPKEPGFIYVIATQYRDSVWDPGTTELRNDFKVRELTVTVRSSWSVIKATYR